MKNKRNAFTVNMKVGLYSMWYWNNKDIYNISDKEFNEIYNAIMDEYADQVANNPHGVLLPLEMGELASEWVVSKRSEEKYLNLSTNFKTIRVVYKIKKCVKNNKYIRLLAFAPSSNISTPVAEGAVNQTEIYKNTRSSPRKVKK